MATMTVRLRRKLVKIHETRRRKKAMDYLREDIAKRSGVEPEAVKINQNVNEYMSINVARNMKPVIVDVTKTGDRVEASLNATLIKAKGQQTQKQTPSAKPAGISPKPAQKNDPAAPKAARPEIPKKTGKPKNDAKT